MMAVGRNSSMIAQGAAGGAQLLRIALTQPWQQVEMQEVAIGEACQPPGYARLVGTARCLCRIVLGGEIDDARGAAERAVARAHAAGGDHAVILVRRQDQEALLFPVRPALQALQAQQCPGGHGEQGGVKHGERQGDEAPGPADVERDRPEQQRGQAEKGDRRTGTAEETEFHL
jgi:hypothetical protein